jgi:oxygen-dependent protoporphyrinogen oxidase
MLSVVIVGGGMAGLSAAYELHRRGVPFSLLEAGPRPGGVVRSEEVDGFVIDGGPDSLLVQKPDAIRLCEQLGLGNRLVPTKPPRLSYVQRGGRLHALPERSVLGVPTEVGPFLRSSLFTAAGKARMGAELFVPRRRDEQDESIGEFIERRFGTEAKEYLAEPLLAGIHAGDVDRLSVRALFPRFTEAERRYGSLLRAFRAQRARRAAEAGDGVFRSLPDGLSEMVRALVAALPPGAVRLNSAAARVLPSPPGDGSTASCYVVETAAGERLAAPGVILATPAYITARLVEPVDADLSRWCSEVDYASTATVALAFRRDAVAHPLNGSGFVVPRREATGILAGSWLSSKWPHRAPGGYALLRAFVGGARDPHGLERTDDELVALALKALTPLLGISSPPVLTRVYRFERANAQHDVGHLARQARIEERLARYPGLFLTGSGFRGVGIPDCVKDGRASGAQAASLVGRVHPSAVSSE